MENFDCVIVGAGHAGAQMAAALRQYGYCGSIALISNEAVAPYDRPSLSKDYLSGNKCFDRIRLRPDSFWAERDIALILNETVTAVAAEAHQLTCASGLRLGYGKLVWATGGQPRRLSCPGHDLPQVAYLRDKRDCDALMARLPECREVVIIGGGYIGLEAAAVLRSRGKSVTLVEAQDRLLARVTAEPVSRFYAAQHRAQGVSLVLGSGVVALTAGSEQAQPCNVHLTDGQILPADLVIVGIGIAPAIAPLAEAGARVSNGAEVDAFCATSLADIYCIGDCALVAGGPGIRVESVQNANDQASALARNLCGTPEPYAALPWFWSNQYDLKLQTIGLNLGYDATVLRGDPASQSFSLLYLQQGRVIAADCINLTRDYVQARKLIEQRLVVSVEMLADAEVPLKTILEQSVTAP